jgi:hypothetical protein
MQVDVKNAFNSVSFELLFLESCVMLGGLLVTIVPFTKLFYGTHSSLYYQHGRHVEGVTVMVSSLSMR